MTDSRDPGPPPGDHADDDVPVFDLDDDGTPENVVELEPQISAPEDRERLLAETMAHAEVRDARYRQQGSEGTRDPMWRLPLGLLLFVMAGWTWMAPPQWAAGPPPPSVSAEDQLQGVRASLHLQALALESFRFHEGRLPRTLDELDYRLDGVRFVRSNNRAYQLVAPDARGRPVVYDSAVPDPAFAEVAWWSLDP